MKVKVDGASEKANKTIAELTKQLDEAQLQTKDLEKKLQEASTQKLDVKELRTMYSAIKLTSIAVNKRVVPMLASIAKILGAKLPDPKKQNVEAKREQVKSNIAAAI